LQQLVGFTNLTGSKSAGGTMIFQNSMKKILAARGYRHCESDEEFTRHGDYCRNIQYAFSKEIKSPNEKVVDIVFLGTDMRNEKVVLGFFRENLSIENGIIENSDTSIPLTKFTLEEFERQLDRLIPKGSPLKKHHAAKESF
jgi:hypothetical protein